jgi:hypothetical protein
MSVKKKASTFSAILAIISLIVIIFTVIVLVYIGGKYFFSIAAYGYDELNDISQAERNYLEMMAEASINLGNNAELAKQYADQLGEVRLPQYETNQIENQVESYTYAEIYAITDQAGLDCDIKHGPPFYSMDQQYAYNNCHNSVNTWELNQLDRTDYYGEPQRESSGGGCLIATATYGSEMSNEVQQLRELRDNQLLQTASGTAFMGTFNNVYYSFSPIIADYERENPLFKEAVKLAITPMISSLSLMENAETESEVLGLGLSVIMLNLGMYLGVPAVLIVGIRKRI